jgi:hypothetical protein
MTMPQVESQEMASDPRDRLWDAAFETYYDSFYEGILADLLIDRWQFLDEAAKCTVALTATGSALAGWALWTEPGFRIVWVIVAGVSAILAILHAALGVAGRVRDWGEVRRYFATLRIDLETLRYRMEFDPEFPLDGFTDSFAELRKKYGEGMQRLRNDILLTRRLIHRAQDKLNQRVADKSAAVD